MGSISYFNIILRLTIWFLLTADLSLANIIIGVGIAFLLPRSYSPPEALKDWLRVFWEIVIAIPVAYIEAIQMMIQPHDHEEIVRERVKPRRTPGLLFLDIFLITFTPKTVVVKYDEPCWFEIHRVRRKKRRLLR